MTPSNQHSAEYASGGEWSCICGKRGRGGKRSFGMHVHHATRSLIDRFHSHYKVMENGCWLWQLKSLNRGYGRIFFDNKKIPAHRWSYENFNGPIPEGMWILHKCDMPNCVNPEHLELGDAQKNTQDAYDRGLAVSPKTKQTHCIRGHELPPKDSSGRRRCAICTDIRRDTPEYKAAAVARTRKWKEANR